MKGLGARIRELREERDISLRELARKMECSAPFLSDIEHGRRHPSEDTLATLARELGTTPDELLKHDVRAPIDDIKRITEDNPRYALAFRTVIDKNISADRLIELLANEGKKHRGK
jgi:transcriptional regulator with XRE-family HTH domain